jgi:hypothetical protein
MEGRIWNPAQRLSANYGNVKMKRFFKWLRRDTRQQSNASEADQGNVGADIRPDQTTENRNSAQFSLTCFGTDQTDSGIFGTGRLDIEKSEDTKSESDNKNTVGVATLNLENKLWPDDENIGVDPYNTGSFGNKNE